MAYVFALSNYSTGCKSGVFDLEGSRVRDIQSLEHLYLAVAIAILFATLTLYGGAKGGFSPRVLMLIGNGA